MTSIFVWVILIIATERATELIVASKIFEPLRSRVKCWVYPIDGPPPPDTFYQHFKIMVDYLFHCGYCVSVWMGGLFALEAPEILSTGRYINHTFVNWFTSLLFLHGMANLYHVGYELLRRGRIKTFDVVLKVSVESNETLIEHGDISGDISSNNEEEDV